MPAALFDLRTAERNAALHNVVRSRARRCLFRRQRAMRQRPRRTAPCTTTRDCWARSSATPSASRTGRKPSRSSRRSGGCRVAFQRKADESRGPQPRHSPHAAEPARDAHRHPRLQLLLPSRQHRRGPPSRAPAPASTSAMTSRRTAAWLGLLRPPARRARIDDRHDRRAPSTRGYVSPVLTAHPTEVQRKSTLDAERAIADLLAERDTPAQPARAGGQRGAAALAHRAAVADARLARPRSSPCATRSRTR